MIFTSEELRKTMDTISKKDVAGPDGITIKCLKKAPDE